MSIAFVQTVFAHASSASSITTGAITTSSGNAVIAGVTDFSIQQTSSTLSDSVPNSWGRDVDVGGTLGNGNGIYSALNITGASTTFTATLSAPGFPSICVSEYSGLATSGAFDQSAFVVSSNETNHSSGNTSTTTQANELLIGVGANAQNAVASITSPGWTQDAQDNAGGFEGLLCGHKIVSATGAYSFDWTAATTGGVSSSIATYKAAAGGGATNRIFYSANLNGIGAGGPFVGHRVN